MSINEHPKGRLNQVTPSFLNTRFSKIDKGTNNVYCSIYLLGTETKTSLSFDNKLVKIVCHLNFSCTICKKNRRGAELRGSHRERSLRQRSKADPNILTQCLSLSSTMSRSTVSMVEVR